eukprot:TRINITY_DN13325_c0_g1_i1.p1 TRINITY_DN13325_c0_g1~~TRINITY_DN13325_c0_g1_i1.p1  ORF type:complete len:784 (+),score=178.30 TRINITY_DN13325_c0_g1_i1:247-2598(+)
MGSLKPSVRSRPGAASGSLMSNGVPSLDGVLTEELSVFESESFDANAYVQSKCQSMSEKGIRRLCSELLDLKKASAEEMRRSVYANYSAFIRTSQEISELEGELVAMRNLLSSQAVLIHGLAEGGTPSLPTSASNHGEWGGTLDDASPTDFERRAEAIPDLLDVLLAERKVEQALATLDEGEKLVLDVADFDKDERRVRAVSTLRSALSERRARLSEQLAEAAQQPSVRGSELRGAIAALDRLGDGPRAHTLLLNSHHERLQHNIRALRPTGTSYGGAYTAALSQMVFSAIAQAARDSVAVFGEQPDYASELVLWARNETENFAMLVKKHVLSSSAAAGGLRAAAECVQIALGHCALLEDQGLALCPVLSKLVRPSVEQALEANLKRIEESVAALAAADDWSLTLAPTTGRGTARTGSSVGSVSNLKLSSSAHRFNTMVQDFLEDVAPLISMQLGGPTLDGLAHLFETYVGMLKKAVPVAAEDEEGVENEDLDSRNVRIAETEYQQVALLGNASALADELLPRAALKLAPGYQPGREEPRARRGSERQGSGLAARLPEQKDWRRRLQRAVDNLRDYYCRQQFVELIFYSEDPDAQLVAETYTSLDANGGDADWANDPMPSKPFQALFAKLTSLAQSASEVLAGRDRVVTLLLMRLLETVVIWLSDDQDFWEAIEEGPRGLGPIGLQQFVLDMQFVIQVASHGRYSSRHMRQVVSDIISRAVNAFATTGMDPNSVLPEDDWFQITADEALTRLLAGRPASTMQRDPTSPTASISAQSVSSMRSE